MPNIYGRNSDLLAKVMDLRMERQNLVMSNMANMHVPGYKARSIDFEGELQNALSTQKTLDQHKAAGGTVPERFNASAYQPGVLKEFKPRTIYGADAVDLDKEMTAMAKNSMQFGAVAMLVQKHFEGIQKAIMEGGK